MQQSLNTLWARVTKEEDIINRGHIPLNACPALALQRATHTAVSCVLAGEVRIFAEVFPESACTAITKCHFTVIGGDRQLVRVNAAVGVRALLRSSCARMHPLLPALSAVVFPVVFCCSFQDSHLPWLALLPGSVKCFLALVE
jgi:hypothetical protein